MAERSPSLACLHAAIPRRFVVGMMLAAVATCPAGCAGWRSWLDPKDAARLAEQYGPTANQRIAELEKRSEEAIRKGEQEPFGRELATLILAEHDPRVRCEIVALSGRIESPQAAGVCEGALDDPDPAVRMAACRAWAERGGERAVTLLASRVDAEQDVDVRLEAVAALGRSRSPAAIPHLARSLEDADPAVQYRAVAALRNVSGRDLGNDVNAWRTWAAKEPAARDAEPITLAERLRQVF
jgi:hypothetical protein